MCGISGFVGDVDNAEEILIQFGSALQHRGPDNSSILIGKSRGFSHTRLSIIDLSDQSNQPMQNEKLEMVFNGEIYNWAELAKKYFPNKKIDSDSQLLLSLLDKFDVKTVTSLIRGIYAIAFFDKHTEELTLLRDEFGAKPLYYLIFKNVIYFASEIKTFLEIPFWKPRLNRDHLIHYMCFQNCFSDCTLFTGVYLVPQNSCVVFKDLQIKRKNRLREVSLKSNKMSDPENLEAFSALFSQSINRNLVSDVPTASFLSGGLDSCLITAESSKQNKTFETFTVGFDTHDANSIEMSYDESEIARKVAHSLGLENHNMRINSYLMGLIIDDVSWAVEDPRVGQSYPNFYAGHLASTRVKVCMSGAGGDEMFGGYPWRYEPVLSQQSRSEQINSLFDVWRRLGEIEEISSLLKLEKQEYVRLNKDHLTEAIKSINLDNNLNLEDILEFERNTFLHGLLVVEDKVSMHHGLEVRVPFLDEDLAEFARTVPSHLKVKLLGIKSIDENDLTETDFKEKAKLQGKILLRNYAKYEVPQIYGLKKQGFSAPDSTWFKNDDHGLVKRLFGKRNSFLWEILDYETAKSLVEEHFAGVKNRRLLIWSLLTLESTFRQFNFT